MPNLEGLAEPQMTNNLEMPAPLMQNLEGLAEPLAQNLEMADPVIGNLEFAEPKYTELNLKALTDNPMKTPDLSGDPMVLVAAYD